MSTAAVRGVVRQFALDDPPTDAALVTRYARTRENAPFAELLRRHGPVVLGVCRRFLADPHAAEDAFQAVFLVLARKANMIRPPGSVGSWLYGVAVRTARKAKVAAARRWRREMASAMAEANPGRPVGGDLERTELRAIIDDELGRLSADLRAAVVLCDLGGKSRAQAARELGCPEGTIAARLHRARKLLADRLTRRGVALPAAGIGAVLSPEAVTAAVSPDLARATLAAAELFATGTAGPAVSPAAQALAEGVIRTMSTGKFKLMLVAVLAAGLMTGAGALWGAAAMNPPDATGGPVPAAAPGEKPPAKPAEQLGYVSHIEFSPDGKRYCVAAGGTVRVHDAASGRVAFSIPGEAAGFTADGKTLFVMGQKVLECDPATGKVRKEHPRPKTKWGWHLVAFSPDGKRYAAHSGFGVRVYDTATGFEPVQLDGQHDPGGGADDSGVDPGEPGSQLVWSPDGKQLAAVGVLVKTQLMSLATGAAVWDAETGKQVLALTPDITDGPRAAAFSPDGGQLAIGFKNSIELLEPGPNPVKKNKKLPTAGPVTALAFSPDGKRLAAGVRLPILNGADKEPAVVGHKTVVQLLDVATRKELKRFDGFEGVNHMAPTRLPVVALAFAPDGKKLLAGTSLPPVVPIPNDFPKTGEVKTFTLDDKAAPPGPPAAAAAGPWREKAVVKDIEGPVTSVAFAPDGKTFAAGGVVYHPADRNDPSKGGAFDGTVIQWDAASLRPRWMTRFGRLAPVAAAYAPDGKWIAATQGETVGFYSTTDGTPVQMKWRFAGGRSVAVSPDGKWLATSDGSGTHIRGLTQDAEAGFKHEGKPDEKYLAPVVWSPDSLYLASVIPSADRKWLIAIVGITPETKPKNISTDQGPITSLAWSPDGKLIATGAADGSVILWDAATGKEVHRFGTAKNRVHALAFSPDGNVVAVAMVSPTLGGHVTLIRHATGVRVQTLRDFTTPPVAVAFSPDGKTLIAGCGNPAADPRKLTPDQRKKAGEVRVFTTEPDAAKPAPKPEPGAALGGWNEKAVLTHHAGPVDSVAFAPDGRSFVSGGAEGRVLLWDAVTLKPQELGGVYPPGKYTAVAYSPDGKLVAATRDKATGFFDPVKRQSVLMNPVVPGGTAVAFDPKGGRVAVSDGQATFLRELGGDGGQLTINGPQNVTPRAGRPPSGLAWSPDGKMLSYIHPDGKGKWWVGLRRFGGDQRLKSIVGSERPIQAIAWSPDGTLFAYAGSDGLVNLLDGKPPFQFSRWAEVVGRDGGPTLFHNLAFSPDGKRLAAAVTLGSGKSADRVILIDTATGKEEDVLFPPAHGAVRSVAFSPDGKLLVAACGIDREKVKPLMNPDEMKAAGAVVVWGRKP